MLLHLMNLKSCVSGIMNIAKFVVRGYLEGYHYHYKKGDNVQIIYCTEMNMIYNQPINLITVTDGKIADC